METLVSCALLGIVLTCVYSMLVAGVRYYKASLTTVQLQQDSLLALMWLTRELGESNSRTVAVFTSPPGILFASPRDNLHNYALDSQGLIKWQKFICYYLEDRNGVSCLVRKEHYLDHPDLGISPPPVVAPVPRSTQTTAYYKTLNVPSRVVAQNVTDLQAQGNSPVELKLVIHREDLGRVFELNLAAKVALRN
ncbi:MAG: hypothetical protein AB1758_26760 [Candidatus Eremiobacterota bacterium]